MTNRYTVIYTHGRSVNWRFFVCEVGDTDLAEQQCENAYPDCEIVGVYEAVSIEETMDRMNEEMNWTACAKEAT